MKYLKAAVMLGLLIGAGSLLSKDGKLVGEIGSVNGSNKEIIINLEGSKSVNMGEKVYLRIGEDVVIMEVTFPMMTTSKCKLVKSSVKYFNRIKNGMNVYKYDKSVEEKEIVEEAEDLNSNFKDNKNGTVKDKKTGLTWQKCSKGQADNAECSGKAELEDWNNAIAYCGKLSLSGKKWRLPDKDELLSIVDKSGKYPPIDKRFFPNTASYYWSSSTYVGSASYAWSVGFNDGGVNGNGKAGTASVRCVSGP